MKGLRVFILEAIERGRVPVERLFGFESRDTPADLRRFGGFGEGVWAPKEIGEYSRQPQNKPDTTKVRKTGLFKNEGDHALAARAHVPGRIVLTREKPKRKKKNDPLQRAFQEGHRVLFWSEFEASGLSLAEYIQREAARPQPSPPA